MPERVRLSRAKGYRKPEGAVVVARPSKWGNPYKVGERITNDDDRFAVLLGIAPAIRGLSAVTPLRAQDVVDAYFEWIVQQPPLWLDARDELAGHDLACWCPLDQPCHADVLLEVANGWA